MNKYGKIIILHLQLHRAVEEFFLAVNRQTYENNTLSD